MVATIEQLAANFIIHDVPQGSPEWFAARAGIITASEFDSLVSPLWKIRAGDGVESYLFLKAAELWRGGPVASFGSGEMEQGTILEDEAIPAFEIITDRQVSRVGFITTEDGGAGCSPDGLLDWSMGEPIKSGCEIKCPQPAKHVAYLIKSEVPKEYLAQVHGAMFVTGAPEWMFVSYCRKFPPLILTVKRDEQIIETIREAVGRAKERLSEIYDKLCELNGKKPDRKIP